MALGAHWGAFCLLWLKTNSMHYASPIPASSRAQNLGVCRFSSQDCVIEGTSPTFGHTIWLCCSRRLANTQGKTNLLMRTKHDLTPPILCEKEAEILVSWIRAEIDEMIETNSVRSWDTQGTSFLHLRPLPLICFYCLGERKLFRTAITGQAIFSLVCFPHVIPIYLDMTERTVYLRGITKEYELNTKVGTRKIQWK